MDELRTRFIGSSIDNHDCKERQKFKCVTSPENKLQLILNGKNTVQKRYQVSLGYIIELSYKNSNYDIIEFENVEDYETCRVTTYIRI